MSVAAPETTPESLATDPAHLRMARTIAATMARSRGLEWYADELESAALMGLWEAARRFEPARGLRFTTYATPVIKGRILDELRLIGARGMGASHFVRGGNSLPVVSLQRRDEESGRELAETIASDELPVGWEIESEDEVEATLRACGEGGAIVRDYLLDAGRATLKQASGARDLSESRGSQLMSEVIDLLRERAGNNGVPRPRVVPGADAEATKSCPEHGAYPAFKRNCPACVGQKIKAAWERRKAEGKTRARRSDRPSTVAPEPNPGPTSRAVPHDPGPEPTPTPTPSSSGLDALAAELDATRAVVAAIEGLGGDEARRRVLARVLEAIGR